jgi:hypothetical protein
VAISSIGEPSRSSQSASDTSLLNTAASVFQVSPQSRDTWMAPAGLAYDAQRDQARAIAVAADEQRAIAVGLEHRRPGRAVVETAVQALVGGREPGARLVRIAQQVRDVRSGASPIVRRSWSA